MSIYYPNPVPKDLSNDWFYTEFYKLTDEIERIFSGNKNLRSVSADYTISHDDHIVLVDATSAAVTITLTKVVDPRVVYVKKIDSSNNVTIATQGSETIDGASTKILTSQYDSLTLTSDGSNWYIL